MPSGCKKCPKCGEETLEAKPRYGMFVCLNIISCGYRETVDFENSSFDDFIQAFGERGTLKELFNRLKEIEKKLAEERRHIHPGDMRF